MFKSWHGRNREGANAFDRNSYSARILIPPEFLFRDDRAGFHKHSKRECVSEGRRVVRQRSVLANP